MWLGLVLLLNAYGQDSFCGVTVGQTFSSVPGERNAYGVAVAPCKLGTLTGTRVAEACGNKVFSVGWNRVYLPDCMGIEKCYPLSTMPEDLLRLFTMMVEAGWTILPDPEPDAMKTVWVKGSFERRITVTQRGEELVLMNLNTTYTTACTEGI